jgi:hypothetical protein
MLTPSIEHLIISLIEGLEQRSNALKLARISKQNNSANPLIISNYNHNRHGFLTKQQPRKSKYPDTSDTSGILSSAGKNMGKIPSHAGYRGLEIPTLGGGPH